MKNKILTTLILIMFCTLAFAQCVKATVEIKTVLQIKGGEASWTNISVSDAFDKCQELKKEDSVLGKTGDNVIPHLVTNADWFAVGILASSDYGSKYDWCTTGNNSGVKNFGSNISFSAGIMEYYDQTTTVNCKSLIDNIDTKFVEKLKVNQEENKPGLGLIPNEIPWAGGMYQNWNPDRPILLRRGLLNYTVGHSTGGTNGAPSGATFRPAIWVK